MGKRGNSGGDWLAWLTDWKYRLLYPYIRRKDAGYLATVLSEYAAVPEQTRRDGLGATFALVERCHHALLLGDDGDADASGRLAAQLDATLDDKPQAALHWADPMIDRLWMQTYLRQLFLVEKAVLQLQRLDQLLARAPMLVERYRGIGGPRVEHLQRLVDQDLAPDRLQAIWDEAEGAAAPQPALPQPDLPGHDGASGDAHHAAADAAGGAAAQAQDNASAKPHAKPPTKPPAKAHDKAHDTPRHGEAWLRAKLTMLLNDIQWSYAQGQVREELFLGQQLAIVGTFAVGCLVLLLGYGLTSSSGNQLVVSVLFFGLLGAFVSIMRRMRADAEQHGGGAESSYRELTALAYGKIGILFSLCFGAVFAMVLMVIFQSGVAQVVFNKSVLDNAAPLAWLDDGRCAWPCFFGLAPGSGREFAKVLLWSFVAGFAERLVPDALDRLTKSAPTK
jgi:hypothetical protein